MPKKPIVSTVFKAVDRISKTLGKMRKGVARFASSGARNMRKLNRAVSKVSRNITDGLKFGALAAAGAATGLYLAVNKVAKSMDRLAKQAREVDFPIEAFQEWRFVAEQSGIDSTKFSKGMLTFNKRLGKLKGGFGPLATALKKTNPELAKQLKLAGNSAEAMDLMVKAMQDAEGADMKSMLADAAFGLTEMSLVGMNSTDTIKGLRKEMRENGVVTEEQAAKAEAYNDMMNRVKSTLEGLMVDVLTPLMPIMKDLADGVREWVVENKAIVSGKLKDYVKKLIDMFPKIVDWGKKIGIVIGIFYGITAAVKAFNVVMGILNLIMMANPFVLLAVAVLAAAALIYLFWDEIQAYMFKFFDAIKAAGQAIGGYFSSLWEKLKAGVTSVWEFLKPGVEAIVAIFTGEWDVAGKKLMEMWTNIKTAAKVAFDWILQKIKPVIDAAKWVGGKLTGAGSSPTARPSGMAAARPPPPAAASATAALSPTVPNPSVQSSRSESVSTEQTEVTLRDETGQARVTKGGKAKGFKLVHSGGMP